MPFVFEQPNLGKPDETTSTSIRAMDVCSLCLPTRPWGMPAGRLLEKLSHPRDRTISSSCVIRHAR